MPYVVNEDVQISYELVDECNGEYLLLHSGLGSNKEAWTELGYTDELKKYYKLISIDPRGHGKSDKPKDLKKYTFKLMAEDVIALLDYLEISEVHFFGYSLGGLIGWVLAKYHRERFISFINGGSRVKSPLFTSNPFLRLPFLQEDDVENKEYMIESYDIEAILPNLKTPVLTFVGDKDQSCYPVVEEYSKEIPNCTTFTLKGLNHPQTIMETSQVLPRVLEFLKP